MSTVPVIFEQAAKQDIRAARDFYANRGESTSNDFRDELILALGLLSRHGMAIAIAFGRTRLKPMRQFPYVIGYVFYDGIVHVTGVLHGGLGWHKFQLHQF